MVNHYFVHDVNLWSKRNYSRQLESAKVHTYQNAIVLPLRINSRVQQTAGGVFEGGGMLR